MAFKPDSNDIIVSEKENMMITIYSITGSLIVLLFLLASLNDVKKYVKSPVINAIAKQQRIFGMLALLSTGLFGALYATKQKSWMYKAHRVMGPVTFVLIIFHIILNSNI
jgi:hypothetical protein